MAGFAGPGADVSQVGFGFGGWGICQMAGCVAILIVICCCFGSACGGWW